jgi:hypothetical protein
LWWGSSGRAWRWPLPASRFFRNRKLLQLGALRARKAQKKLKTGCPGKNFGLCEAVAVRFCPRDGYSPAGYATQSDTAPGNSIGSAANLANWAPNDVYSLTQTGFDFSGEQNYLTDVGAFSGSGSFYGTFDQSGNVSQLNDLDGTPSADVLRGVRGGGWSASNPIILSSSYQNRPVASDSQASDVGFRLVSPPSPRSTPLASAWSSPSSPAPSA